jgi:predicted heme/steroid binding protein
MSKRRKLFNISQLPDGFGGGVDQFIELTDTPSTYTGQVGKSVRVNSAENGLEFYTPSEVGSNISFLDLIDTPSSYTGQGLRLLRVNTTTNAIEFDPNTYVTTARSISTNNGLTGGGDLSADRTIGLTGQALALHNLSTNGIISRTGSGTVAARTITAGTGITVSNGDGVSGNPTITLNATLANLSGVVFTSLTTNQTLVYNGTNWVNQAYTTGTVTSIVAGTGLSGGSITTTGTISFDTVWGDARYSRLVEVIDSQTIWSHVSLQNGIDFTPYTTGSAGYPSTLGFAVAFYASTSDSTSGFGRAFALNRSYNTESYFIGSPNTSGVHNGWRLIYHSGNLTLSTLGGVPTTTTLTINGTAFDLSTNRSWSVGTVTSIIAGTGLSGGTITGSGTIALTGQALSFHNLATNGIIYRNGATIATRTITGSTFITVTNGDGGSGNPTITLGTLNLGDLSNVVLTTPASGQVLSFNGTNWVNSAISGGGGGTVTSIATGTGLTGGTITTTGTISVVFGTTAGTVAEGNDTRILNGNTAFGWGNHATVGYLLSSTASTTYVPLTRTITINGTALDLSANRSWSVGTVTSVATGTGLTGGTITGTGTISLTGQALALHNLATNGIISRTGAGTVAARTITAGTGISITNGDGVAGNPTITSTITQYTDALARAAISLTTTGNSGAATYSNSTGVFNIPNYTLTGLGGQPLSANLTSLASLTFVSGSFVRMTATGTFTLDTSVYYLASNPNGYTTNTGTVTSVGLSLPAIFTVTGSPVTGSGTLTATLASQSANIVFASPNGSAGTPTFRALVAADIPNLDTSKITSGTFGVARGGTGISSYTVGNFIYASGTTTLAERTPAQVLSDIGAASSSHTHDASAIVSGTLATARLSGTYSINITGNSTGVVDTVTGTNSKELVRGNMADNDQFRILVGGTASNAGFAEIATADDGSEPIHVRQYTGTFVTLVRTATLLDGSGNTSFPGNLTAASIIRSGGTSSQFLKADGSVDSNTYGLSNADISAVSLTSTTLTLTRSAGNLTASVPTFNQNTTGSAGSLSDDSAYFRTRTAVTNEAALDTTTFNGFTTVGYSGFSKAVWNTNTGGSVGTIQHEYDYNVPVRGWRIRNRTDSTTWSSWGWVVMTTANQGHIGGTILHSGNFNTYSPTLTGGGASGTWGISITGNADTVDGYHASTSTLANTIVVREGSGYIFGNYLNMTDDGNPGAGTAITSFITKQGDNYYRSVSPTNAMVSIRTVASGTWGISITGNAATVTNGVYTTSFDYTRAPNEPGTNFNTQTSNSYVSTINADTNTPFGFAWYNLVNIRHRGGFNDGNIWGGQIAFGMTNYRNRIAFRTHNNGTWDGWTEIFTGANGNLQNVTSVGSTTSNSISITNPGNLSFGSQTRQMVSLWGTEYGIGVQSSTAYFRTGSSFAWYRLGSHNDTQFSPGSGGAVVMTLDGSNNLSVTGDVIAFASSDSRLKDNLTKIDTPLEKLSKVSGYTFDWNSNQETYKGKDYGVVAQEIEEVFPELVKTRDNGYKAVKYEKLIPVLIEAIKELQLEINKLKK